jgi:CRP-like cAMP-binding protein
MARFKVQERFLIALLKLPPILGTRLPHGATRLPSLTHLTIAEYIGTSREIATSQMNRLKRLGMIRYTRRYLEFP